MAAIDIIQVHTNSSLDVGIRKALENVRATHLGTVIQDKATTQITTDWDPDQQDSSAVRELKLLLKSEQPATSFHVTLNQPAFGSDGPAVANVVEFAQSFFPASKVTPEFKRQIEQDFLTFESIYTRNGVNGSTSSAFGWVLEEQDHEDIKGEKAASFIVLRGWEAMRYFELSLETEAYKEAISILFGWKAPFKMVGLLLRCACRCCADLSISGMWSEHESIDKIIPSAKLLVLFVFGPVCCRPRAPIVQLKQSI